MMYYLKKNKEINEERINNYATFVIESVVYVQNKIKI